MSISELQRRFLYIIHRGLVEGRLLAQAKEYEQLYDLMDALEPLPGYMAGWDDNHINIIRYNLKMYRDKYPSPSFDYPRYLDVDPVPDRF